MAKETTKNEKVKTTVQKTEVTENKQKKDIVQKSIQKKEYHDSDIVEVKSLVSGVYYVDKRTGDSFVWEKSDEIQEMTIAELKEMKRRYKTYFSELWLQPVDQDVIDLLGFTRVYKDYSDLMCVESYTRDNIVSICEKISKSSNGLKITVANKIKSLVTEGKISDSFIINKLERGLGIDLFALIN